MLTQKESAERRREKVKRRLDTDTRYYAEHFLKIVDKEAQLRSLIATPGQVELERIMQEQEKAGKPIRVIILKARQTGMSTWVQAKLLQRVTRNSNHRALVVAHDKDTAKGLFRIAERMLDYLPDDDLNLRPFVSSYGKSTRLEFGQSGKQARAAGDRGLDSLYMVDTARDYGGGQVESGRKSERASGGRGATYHSVHASELAFWPDPIGKLTALKNAVGRLPGTMFVIESTANGYNHFRDLWIQAEKGDSNYAPFFWPWWREPTYSTPFLNPYERQAFRVGDTAQSPYAEEEPDLVERFQLTLEQLHWRRLTIADELSGRADLFKQEYPSDPEEAFISSGSMVFDPALVKKVIVLCERTDPKVPTPAVPGPELGMFKAGERVVREGLRGKVEVPAKPIWVPRADAAFGTSWWKIWRERLGEDGLPDSQYIVSGDVASGGVGEGYDQPAAHALEIIDHKTGLQVAEFQTRGDPDLIADEALLAALYFRDAWVCIEITGGWGLPVMRRIYFDYRYVYIYRRRSVENTQIREEHRLGYDTTTKTKPIIETLMQEELRTGAHGIASRELANEMLTFIRDERGRTAPQRGHFSDRLMAYMIAKQIRLELPVKQDRKKGVRILFRPRDALTGY